MIESIQTSTATPLAAASDATSKDSQGGRGAPQSAPVVSAPSSDSQDAPVPAQPATRLLIDQDKLTGVYVYRIVDSGSGRLLAEIPSDQIDNLKDADDYVSGSVISTSV